MSAPSRDAYFALGVRQVWLVDRWTKSIDPSKGFARLGRLTPQIAS
jgi:hypothetical protein